MKRFALLPVALLAAGCGYVGDPQPPALKMPVAVADLKAWQRGAKIVIEFTAPDRTTEGLPLARFGEVDLKAGFVPPGAFHTEAWAAAARRLEATVAGPGAVHVETTAKEWVGRTVILGVRMANANGRFSDWSNLVGLEVAEPLSRPDALVAEAVPEGVRLRWRVPDRPGQTFRIRRRIAAEDQAAIVAQVTVPEWTDMAATSGTSYEYSVQTALKVGGAEAESEVSDNAVIEPRDVFPPAAPQDLAAISATGAIELGWERNTEADLAGYRVYRSKNGSAFERMADSVEAPSYSDRSIEAGAKYAYTVTAFDQNGNESPRSAPAEIEVR